MAIFGLRTTIQDCTPVVESFRHLGLLIGAVLTLGEKQFSEFLGINVIGPGQSALHG